METQHFQQWLNEIAILAGVNSTPFDDESSLMESIRDNISSMCCKLDWYKSSEYKELIILQNSEVARSINRRQQRECFNKKPRTQEEATNRANLLSIELGKPMNAYECSWCGEWHVGGSEHREEQMKIEREAEVKKKQKRIGTEKEQLQRKTYHANEQLPNSGERVLVRLDDACGWCMTLTYLGDGQWEDDGDMPNEYPVAEWWYLPYNRFELDSK